MMMLNPYPTYEAAVRDYLAKFHVLAQLSTDGSADESGGMNTMPVQILLRQAEEIAEISSCMIILAGHYLDSSSRFSREWICGHFLDQAVAEWLLGISLFRIGIEGSGELSTAASRATYSAALGEAISAAEKSASMTVIQGLPINESCRSAEYETLHEAVSAFQVALANSTSSISRRVQELGRDITYELVSRTSWEDVLQGISLSGRKIPGLLEPISNNVNTPFVGAIVTAQTVLKNACEKLMALLDRDVEDSTRGLIATWLKNIRQANNIELLDSMIEEYFEIETLKKTMEIPIQPCHATIQSMAHAADLLKTYSDKFTVLINRMRKLEDAIRLGKQIQIPEFLLIVATLQVTLLSVLIGIGHDSINKGLSGILRDCRFMEL
jgi:hypothetical protein